MPPASGGVAGNAAEESALSEKKMAQPLQKIIASRYGGRDLPVTLILPDGGRIPLSAQPEVEIFARSWSGLKALASPALGSLARAYVRNDIDFTGGARAVLRVAEAMVGSITHGRDSLGPGGAGSGTSSAAIAGTSSTTTTSRTPSIGCGSIRGWSIPAPTSTRDGESLADAQARKLDHICRKLRLRPGETLLDIGCGWGGLVFWAAEHYGATATGITLSRHQFEHVSARSPRAGSRAACT